MTQPSAQPQKQQNLPQADCVPDPKERLRLKKLNVYEAAARKEGYILIAGVDEAGRGPLAGPVVAAACMIPKGIYLFGIDDSKKLSPKKRGILFEQIMADRRISYGIGIASVQEIDLINILQATLVAMQRAIEALPCKPELLLVDGREAPNSSITCKCIVGGDGVSQSIAAASIIAKETRDGMMKELHLTWPQYGFDLHKGYGTEAHLAALAEHGPCPIHRTSFAPTRKLTLEQI